MKRIEDTICEAIELIVDKAVNNAGYDKTIQAIIKSCVDETTGKYLVQYQDSTFYAYSSNLDYTYGSGVSVYVLVPGNDMTDNKTIIGAVDNLGIDYINQASKEDLFDKIGANCVGNSANGFNLSSYRNHNSPTEGTKVTYLEVLYDAEHPENNRLEINQEFAELYLTDASSILCGGFFKTNLDLYQKNQGNYGIIYGIDFYDNTSEEIVTRYYIVDVDNMEGNPYELTAGKRQYNIFDIDGENFNRISSISIFTRDFPNHKEDAEIEAENLYDIFISDIELFAVQQMTEEEISSCGVTLLTPKGTFFGENALSSDTLTLKAQVKVKGKLVNSDNLSFYWFKENLAITANSYQYNQYGGRGWECLNAYRVIVDDEDGVNRQIEWVPAQDTYEVGLNAVKAKKTNFKCIVIYNETAYGKTVTIENRKTAVPNITIESDSGTQFYYDAGRPNLTCKINGIENTDYTYVWAKQDAYGNVTILPEDSAKNDDDYSNYSEAVNDLETLNSQITSGAAYKNASAAEIARLTNIINSYKYTQMVHQNKLLKVAINEITNFAIFKCSVYNGDTYLGTASITLSNSLQTDKKYSLVINGGNQTYQYNEYGVSPASKSLEKYITIPALSFTVYDNNGIPLSEEALRGCEVTWKVPSSRSMLIFTDAIETEDDEEGYAHYTDVNTINYKIRDKFYYDYKNNDVELFVYYKDQELVAKTNLTFIKQGDDGTNGTSYSCKIIPNTVDYFESYPTFTTSSSGTINISGTFNFNDFILTSNGYSSTAPFIVKLYKSGEEIFSGSASGTTNKTDTGEEIEVLVEWGILANIYDATNHDLSDFEINSTNGYMKFTNAANNAGRIGANSIKCTVNFTDIDGRLNVLYATLPINVVRISDTDYRITLNDNTGFRYAVYSSDGINPKYDDTKPFELTVYRTINNIEEEISNLTNSNLYYVWDVEGDYYDFYTGSGAYVNSENLIYQNFRVNSNQGRVKPAPSYNGLCVNNRVYCEVHTDSTSGTLVGRIDIPINLFLNRYGFAHLNAWDGNSIQLNEEGGFILAPQIGAGKKENGNSFTGILMGEVRDPNNDNSETGLFGYSSGERSFFLDAETGSAYFRGTIDATAGTIGGIHLAGNAIYSGSKSTYSSTNQGFHLNSDGSLSIGNATDYIKWSANDGLLISTDNFIIKSSGKTVQQVAEQASAASEQASAASAAALDVQTRANNGEFDGADGTNGTDGRGISSTDVDYAEGTDGDTAPQSGWQSEVPTITAGNYLWTRVIINYTDNTTSTSYSVSRQGINGTGVTISSTEVKYAVSTNGTQPPSDFPYTSPQTTTTGQYLWTRTIVNYSDGNSTTAYSCAAHGATGPKGDKGDTGVSISSVTNYYLASNLNSGVTKATSGWKTDVSQVTLNETNCYLWNYEVTAGDNNQEISSTNPVIIGHYAKNGQSGADAIACVLSNESHTFAGTESAAVGETIDITIYAYKGTTSLTPSAVTWSGKPSEMNITLSNDKTTITVEVTSSFNTANGVIPFSITLDGKTIVKNFSYAIAFKGTGGSAGADAKIITLTGATQAIKVDKAGNKTPSGSFTVIGTATNTTISSWTYSTNGGSFSGDLPDGVSKNGNTVTIDPNSVGFNTLSIKASDGDKASDVFSIVRVVDGDDGSNGRGISQITEYYAVNNDASNAPMGSDWKTTVQTTSANNRYLWNYEVITYIDGTPTTSSTDPRIIGTYGDSGTSSYTWIKYSANSDGSNATDAPQSDTKYIGVQVTTTNAKPTSGYTWSRYRGVNVSRVTPLYYCTNVDSGITSPTNVSQVVNNVNTYNAWNQQCPAWTSTNRYYFTCNQITYDDNTYSWSVAVRSLGLETANLAAATASTNANRAIEKQTQLYYLYLPTTTSTNDDNTTDKPAKPTDSSSPIDSTSTSSGVWTTVLPAPRTGYKYYTCTEIKYIGSSNYTYTDVRPMDTNSTIAAWCHSTDYTKIDGGNIFAHSVTASQIATDAIKSTNYIEASSANSPYSVAGSFFNLANGNIYTPNFGVQASGKAYLNGEIIATSGTIGDNKGKNYWIIGNTVNSDGDDFASIVGKGDSYIQSGDWQIHNGTSNYSMGSINTQEYVSNGSEGLKLTYPYYDEVYYDYGMTSPVLDTTSNRYYNATVSQNFLYIRKHAKTIPSLASDWQYLFRVDKDGIAYVSNLYVGGTDIATLITNGVSGGGYLSTANGGTVSGPVTINNTLTVNGNASIAGTLTATASKAIADKDGHDITTTYHKLTGSNTNTADNTFSKAGGFIYSGIENGTSAGDRPVWFSYLGTNGRPVYNTQFQYNPNTNNLTVGKINNYTLAAAATKNVDTSIALNSTSTNLPTSQAIANFVKTNYLPLTGGQITGEVSFGDTINADDLNASSLVVTGSASVANNLQVNTINGVAVGSNPKFTDTNYYHTSGSWGGTNNLTYTATANGGAGALAFTLATASTSAYGATKLTSATNSDSEVLAATAKAVKTAYDLANSKTANTGTVTSIRVQATSPLTSTTSTASSTTLDTTIKFTNQNKNLVLAGPSSGNAAAPTFRSLVADDIPSLAWSKIGSGKPTTLSGYGITDAAGLNAITGLSATSNDAGVTTFTATRASGSDPLSFEVSIVASAATGANALKDSNGPISKGSTTKPVYFSNGVPAEANTYAGGTAVTLNNASKASSTASFYAPTSGGTTTQVLVGNGTTSAPIWKAISDLVPSSATYATYDASESSNTTKTTIADKFVKKSGDTMTGQLKTSFKSSVAIGSYNSSQATVPDLCEELRYSSGATGSVSITTAYTKDNITIATGWYNFLWVPHRSGGVNGAASSDNCNYGSLYLSGMTVSGLYMIRYASQAIAEVKNLYKPPAAISADSATTAATATNVAWTGITSNPITFSQAAYGTTGWSQLGGRTTTLNSIRVWKPTDTVTWGTASHSAVMAYGCGDTKGMLDISYSSPLVSIAGGNAGGSTDDAPKWYFKLSATSGATYTFPTSSKTLAASDGSNASGTWGVSISGNAANVTGTVAVNHGGTGATTLTSGAALIGNGTDAVTTRAITNVTSGAVTASTNLVTANSLVSHVTNAIGNFVTLNTNQTLAAAGTKTYLGLQTYGSSGISFGATSGTTVTPKANIKYDDSLEAIVFSFA